MQTMYPGQPNSPRTTLAQAIDATQTTIEVTDGTKLPDAPNIAVIGTDENAETILYESKEGNILSNVTRAFQGTARSWPAGSPIARNFTAYDYDALRQNLSAHLAEITQKFLNVDLNIIDMAVELEILKDATLNGVTANIFVETFQNLDDIKLERGTYNQTKKRLEV